MSLPSSHDGKHTSATSPDPRPHGGRRRRGYAASADPNRWLRALRHRVRTCLSNTSPKAGFIRYSPELQTGGHTASGVPFLQLLGSDPELMAANAERAARMGAPGIDLNFGCPAKTVNRSRGGAALLRSPQLIRSICERVRDRVPSSTPVTAKIRLGFDSDDLFEEILDALAAVPLTEVTIHARTRKQGYRPPAHWHLLRKARQQLPFPVIANGELWTPADIARCARSVAVTPSFGTRALCRPDLGAAVQALYSGLPAPDFGWDDARAMLIDFLKSNLRLYDRRYAINPVKQWLVYMQVYYPQAAALFAQIKRITDPDTMAAALTGRGPVLSAA